MSTGSNLPARRGNTRRDTRPSYSKSDDKVILKYVSRNPGNLAYAFEQAATELGRSPGGVQGRYYGYLRSDEDAEITVVSRHGSTPRNLKIVRRPNPRNDEEMINLNGVALQVIIPRLSKREKALLLTKLLEEE